MTESFDSFNAPQFFDFSKDLHIDENVDAYFEIDHENIQPEDPSEDPLKFKNSEVEDGSIFYSPGTASTALNDCEKECDSKPRRSMSVGDLKLCAKDYPDLTEVKENSKAEIVNNSEEKKQGPKYKFNSLRKTGSNASLNKDKAGPTRTSAPRLYRAASKENLDRLAQPKRYGSAQNLNHGNYISTAEAVRKFQTGTPTRFRTKPKMTGGVIGKLPVTIPQSPALMTKARHRPTFAVSREEQEQKEFEEAQKFKIKANPLNKKVLQGPIKPQVPMEKKPCTVVEPFKITAPRKIAESPKKETFEFHAKPVPKLVYEPPKLKEVQRMSITKPQTPTFMRRYAKEPVKPQEAEEPKQPRKLEKTVPVPFSFDRRDQSLPKKKEDLIKKVMEEEKKAREFHARPVPRAILNSAKSNSSLKRSDSADTLRSNITKSEENLTSQFKARPPTVLYKKPFEPKKERHLIEISEFQLNTEQRAREREEFEYFLKLKEEKIAQAKQNEEEWRLQEEEEERARLRREAEYKAQPIKKYKELVIKPSGKVTEPKSPKFHTGRRRDVENKENSSV